MTKSIIFIQHVNLVSWICSLNIYHGQTMANNTILRLSVKIYSHMIIIYNIDLLLRETCLHLQYY
jgi:hypothetical protein